MDIQEHTRGYRVWRFTPGAEGRTPGTASMHDPPCSWPDCLRTHPLGSIGVWHHWNGPYLIRDFARTNESASGSNAIFFAKCLTYQSRICNVVELSSF